MIKPGLNGQLLSFKVFMEMQENPISMEDAEKYYNEYKTAHDRKQSEIFYQMHKEDHWFREKYDPQLLFKWKNEQKKQAQVLSKKFFDSLKNEEFKGICLEHQEDDTKGIEENKGESKVNSPIDQSPYFGFDANKNTLFLKQIPVKVSRWDLLDTIKSTPGFISLSMSEPLRSQDFVRYAWVTYDSDENLEKSKTILEKFYSNPVKSVSTTQKSVKVTPFLSKGSITRDCALSKKLIEVLDQAKEIENNPLLEAENSLSEQEQLDLQLLYLRRVHAFCYYCCEEYDDERMLASKCGPQHVRLMKLQDQSEAKEELDDGEVVDEDAPTLFEQKNSDKIQAIISKGPQLMNDPEEDKELVDRRTQYCQKKTKELNVDRYSCQICDKLFRAPHYVEKHLLNKHDDEVYKKVDQKRFEELLFENYMNDPNKFINQPTNPFYQNVK